MKIGFRINITAFVAVMLFSCSNPDSVIRELASDDTLSGIIADSVTFYRSDSGIVKVELHAPRLIRMESEDPVLEFPMGFIAYMYDKNHEKTTEFRADYGKSHQKGGLIEAFGNVVVENVGNHQIMYSDKLFWYQEQKMIYTRSHVKIVSPDKQVEADSLVSKEDFSEYTMYYGKADLEVDEQE